MDIRNHGGNYGGGNRKPKVGDLIYSPAFRNIGVPITAYDTSAIVDNDIDITADTKNNVAMSTSYSSSASKYLSLFDGDSMNLIKRVTISSSTSSNANYIKKPLFYDSVKGDIYVLGYAFNSNPHNVTLARRIKAINKDTSSVRNVFDVTGYQNPVYLENDGNYIYIGLVEGEPSSQVRNVYKISMSGNNSYEIISTLKLQNVSKGDVIEINDGFFIVRDNTTGLAKIYDGYNNLMTQFTVSETSANLAYGHVYVKKYNVIYRYYTQSGKSYLVQYDGQYNKITQKIIADVGTSISISNTHTGSYDHVQNALVFKVWDVNGVAMSFFVFLDGKGNIKNFDSISTSSGWMQNKINKTNFFSGVLNHLSFGSDYSKAYGKDKRYLDSTNSSTYICKFGLYLEVGGENI